MHFLLPVSGSKAVEFCFLIACIVSAVASGAPRDVQFRTIDFEASTIELFNFGPVAEDLSGWMFCTHDEDQSRHYSKPLGLNGVSIASGESLFIHFNNDAPAEPNALNASSLVGVGPTDFGRFAGPLDRGPYAIGLYFSPMFSDGNQIADHVQWNIDGGRNSRADERSDEAQSGGVWLDQNQWVLTTPDTQRIELNDLSGSALHGSDSYIAIFPELEGITLNGSGDTYQQDFNLALGNNGTATGQPLPTGWSGTDRARFFKEVVTESFPVDESLGRGTLLFNAGAGQDADRALAIGVGRSADGRWNNEGVLQLLADIIEQDASSLRLQFDLEVWDAARTNVDLPGEAAFDLTVDINTGDGFTQLIDLGTVTTGPGLFPPARDFLNGNVDPNRASFDSGVLPAPIPAGSTLRIRWTVDPVAHPEVQTRGWVYGLDNVTFSVLGDGGRMLQAGDADQDLDFDQLDLVQVQIAGKYLTGQAATWGEGDWSGAPGGTQGNPPQGDGLFNQLDIVAAQQAGIYLTGTYAAVQPNGQQGDGQTSIVYNVGTGELAVDTPAGTELTSINIDSVAGIFTGSAAENLGGSFDNDADNNTFKATFGSSFGSLSFGNVAQPGMAEEFVLNDLTLVGSLAGGGDLGAVDLIYVPEPSSSVTLVLFSLCTLGWWRRRKQVTQLSRC